MNFLQWLMKCNSEFSFLLTLSCIAGLFKSSYIIPIWCSYICCFIGYSHSHTTKSRGSRTRNLHTHIYPSTALIRSLLDHTWKILVPLELGIYICTYPSSTLNRLLPDPTILSLIQSLVSHLAHLLSVWFCVRSWPYIGEKLTRERVQVGHPTMG